MKETHVVLGANGGVGKQLMKELQSQGKDYRAVARSLDPTEKKNLRANLLNLHEAQHALKGAHTAYLCVGLPYDVKVWKTQWPILIQNVLEAAQENDCQLVFLDNVYMYGPAPLERPFDEQHALHPSSEKGKVRKQIADTVLEAHASGKVRTLIARAADFLGPDATNSIFYIAFLQNMLKGKSPQLFFPVGVPHTFANTRDLARGMVHLGMAADCYGQVWHLPVGDAITIGDMGNLFNQELERMDAIREMPRWLQKALGLFIRPLRELEEMRYQFEHPYLMSWKKFQKRFPEFQRTDYPEVVKEMIASFKD